MYPTSAAARRDARSAALGARWGPLLALLLMVLLGLPHVPSPLAHPTEAIPTSIAATHIPPPADPTAQHSTVRGDTAVNPYLAYRNEPAPMGLAEYGITPNGTGVNLSTSEFLGSATIGALDASSTGGAGHLIGVQLNAVLSIGGV